MPEVIVDKDGKEHQVPTAEEQEAAAKAKADEIIAQEREGWEQEKTNHAAQLETLNTELGKFKDKDYNFNQLREKLKAAGVDPDKVEGMTDQQVGHELEKTVKELQTTMQEIKTQPIKQSIGEFRTKTFGKDKETAEKFDHYMEKLAKDETDPEKVSAAMKEAAILATAGNQEYQNNNSGVTQTGTNEGGFIPSGGPKDKSFDQEMKKGLGISEEDVKTNDLNKPVDLF